MLQALPPQHRNTLHEFWRQVRHGFDDLDEQIRVLQHDPQPRPASRPSTSASVNNLREEFQVALDNEALQQQEASRTVEKIWDLDPTWVHNNLTKTRVVSGAFGCWTSSNVEAHPSGYGKVNLRNTKRPGTNEKIGCQPFIHQLAIVAKGQGQNLLNTQGGQYEVRCLLHLQFHLFEADHDILPRFRTFAIMLDASTPTTSLLRART